MSLEDEIVRLSALIEELITTIKLNLEYDRRYAWPHMTIEEMESELYPQDEKEEQDTGSEDDEEEDESRNAGDEDEGPRIRGENTRVLEIIQLAKDMGEKYLYNQATGQLAVDNRVLDEYNRRHIGNTLEP